MSGKQNRAGSLRMAPPNASPVLAPAFTYVPSISCPLLVLFRTWGALQNFPAQTDTLTHAHAILDEHRAVLFPAAAAELVLAGQREQVFLPHKLHAHCTVVRGMGGRDLGRTQCVRQRAAGPWGTSAAG